MFQCTATGKPIPKITWFKGKSEKSIGETLSFRVDRADSGKYWCEADNGLGFTIRAGAYLNVQCKKTERLILMFMTVLIYHEYILEYARP